MTPVMIPGSACGSTMRRMPCQRVPPRLALTVRNSVGTALSASSVYVGCTDGSLYCLNRSDGTVRWIYETADKIVGRPLIHEGTIYVPSMDGRIYAVVEYE